MGLNEYLIIICLGCACIYFIFNSVKGQNPKILRNILMIGAMIMAMAYQTPLVSSDKTVKTVFAVIIIILLVIAMILTYCRQNKN